MFVTQLGIDDMEGLLIALKPVLDERKDHPILLFSRMKEGADMALGAKV
jgi:hypothetical protein